MKLEISNHLSSLCKLGILTCSVSISKSDADLVELLDGEATAMRKLFTLDNFTSFPALADSRSAYTALGRNPARYPVSSEALIKRLLQGKGLYFINNVVEVNNLVSIRSGYSVGSYSTANLSGPISFRQGLSGEKYKGIGKAEFELENLPLLADEVGPFGSPTSDSERAMITPLSTEIMLVVYGFGASDLTKWLGMAAELLTKHAQAEKIEMLTY